ncbi:uncharacterized protein KY384_002313 [Bacidia gigantensis]|uniref:uncharacterized protein n=1 Tax=Bacidia gigantensis TaxID=2732470 RepID=UPI001D039F9A|nr:uncharacterized protein KY384_002313 [Bacidia gigantensis]KAG8532436.1 hypothetical protein KY384_002313 [Bacidia gigantensis]
MLLNLAFLATAGLIAVPVDATPFDIPGIDPSVTAHPVAPDTPGAVTAGGGPTDPNALAATPESPWPKSAPDNGAFEFVNSCQGHSDDDLELLFTELLTATDILKKGIDIKAASAFYQVYFSPAVKNQVGFELQVNTKYRNAYSILTRTDGKVKITCDANLCNPTTVAFVIAELNILNLCPLWWDDNTKKRSSVASDECQPDSDKTDDWFNIGKFKATKADDYAYGARDCSALVGGYHDSVRCGPDKNNPNGPKGRCDPKLSFENADNLAFVVAGEYWNQRCNKVVTVGSADNDPAEASGQDLQLDASGH